MVGSTIPKRAFGRFLRGLRERVGASLLTASLQIDTSKQTMVRLEDGLPTKVTTPQLKSLLDLYEVDSDVRREALEMWQDVRQQDKAAKLQGTYKGWWQAYADQYAPHFDHYLRLEATSNHWISHQLVHVPGLLQTSEYRRAIIRAAHADLTEIDVDRRLELAARRQERTLEPDFRMDAVLSEAVLRHRPGGPAVMAAQLRHLAEAGTRDNVSIRVVPFSADTHAGLGILSFTLLEFPLLSCHLKEPPCVYIDGAEGALYLESDRVIERFKTAISSMQRVALSERDTRDLMSDIAKEYAA
ncbi:helix-turn-helix domain-containing protein [Nocardia tengchongensis]|uniref:helix-turn-helix domain-containing protein n=1 Tax=Nocardia tengchongensis TaxID=2055889 RepID=UPI0036BDE3A2